MKADSANHPNVFISETLLSSELFGFEFLSSKSVDFCVCQTPSEMLSLIHEHAPRLLILDMSWFFDGDIEKFIDEVHGRLDHQSPQTVPIWIGILDPGQNERINHFYSLGLHYLFPRPLDRGEFEKCLVDVLGRQFRLHERKRLDLPLVLTNRDRIWNVVGRTINEECLLVEGTDLPPIGLNVFIQAPNSPEIQFDVWARSWRRVENGSLLLFLRPPAEFKEQLSRLEPFPAVASSERPTALAHDQIDLSILISWMTHQQPVPQQWSSAIDNLSEFERSLVLNSSGLEPCVLLKLQMTGWIVAARDWRKGAQSFTELSIVLKGLSTEITRRCQDLQDAINRSVFDQAEEKIQQVNRLKSDLQLNYLEFKKIMGLRERAFQPAAPKSEKLADKVARTPQLLLPTAKRVWWPAALAITALFMPLVFFSFGYYVATAPRRAYTAIPDAQVRDISPYAKSIQELDHDHHTAYFITLGDAWLGLTGADQDHEIKQVAEQLNSRHVQSARMIDSRGHTVAWIASGTLQILPRQGGIAK